MVGTITNSNLLGGWILKLKKLGNMQKDLEGAFKRLFGKRLGATYAPAWYIAVQVSNGINHMLAVERTKLVGDGEKIKDFAIVTINIPPGDENGRRASIVSETDATDFVLRDEIETGFKKAMDGYTGMKLKPIFELGTQIVKGTNYHFLCEATPIGAVTAPHLARVAINHFEDSWAIVEIERLY